MGLAVHTWLCLPEARIGIVTGNTLEFSPSTIEETPSEMETLKH